MSGKVLWEITPNTQAKHTILEEYLKAWFGILGQSAGRAVFIDGFAGPGEYTGGEPGSPIVAMNTLMSHTLLDRFGEIALLFIENDEDRCSNLKRRLLDLELPSNVTVQTVCGRFDATVREIVDDIRNRNRVLAPTLAFVDPFGFSGIPFELLSDILSYDRCEVLVTLMSGSINRWRDNPGNETHLDETFGTDAWRHLADADDLVELYKSQLLKETRARYTQVFEMRDENNRRTYHLVFATANSAGLEPMKRAMWKVDESGHFRFSALELLRGQRSLFETTEIHSSTLSVMLKDAFSGCQHTITYLEKFTVENTPYLAKHLRPALANLIEKKQAVSDPAPLNLGPRPMFRKGSRVTFI